MACLGRPLSYPVASLSPVSTRIGGSRAVPPFRSQSCDLPAGEQDSEWGAVGGTRLQSLSAPPPPTSHPETVASVGDSRAAQQGCQLA